jgi:ABC-type Fe3+-hydroxamate transport system substrate-binding protein
MRVISLVPSLTETLIEADVEVVGRTRFCIHPGEKVKSITVVGGTKNVDWAKVEALKADLIILDKEENPKSFAEESPIPYLATHTQDIKSLAVNLKILGTELKKPQLNNYALRLDQLTPKKIPLSDFVHWVTPPTAQMKKIEYVIWKDPIMAVGKNTFIGSVLSYLGHDLPLYDSKYPKLSDKLSKETTYLFSSEPYPFLKHTEWIKSCLVPAGTVDGESFSWFGVRSLKFLEKLLLV